MGNCSNRCRKFQKKFKDKSDFSCTPLSILIIGLDGAGKSEIGHILATNGNSKKERKDFSATNGCHIFNTKINGCPVQFTEVGGAEGIRKIWPYYYQDAEGIIFVVDSTDYVRLDETRKLFAQFINNIYITGKPILILATKQDSYRSIDTIAVCYYMDIERLANETCTPCFMEAFGIGENYINNGIFIGIQWLTNMIRDNLSMIRNRIEFDRLSTPSNISSNDSKRSNRRVLTARRLKNPKSAKITPRPQSAPPKIVIPALNYFVSEASSPVSRAVLLTPPISPSLTNSHENHNYRFIDRLPHILSSDGEIEVHKVDNNNSVEIQSKLMNGGDVLVVTDLHSEVDE